MARPRLRGRAAGARRAAARRSAPPQRPPRNGTAPRIDTADVAKRVRRTEHTLLAYCGADGYPVVLPVELGSVGADGIELRSAAALPPGGRRAGLLGHSYRPRLVGLDTRSHTGWFEGGRYAPHTQAGYRAPPNKTFLLLLNGLLAKRGVRQARKAGKLPLVHGRSRGSQRGTAARYAS